MYNICCWSCTASTSECVYNRDKRSWLPAIAWDIGNTNFLYVNVKVEFQVYLELLIKFSAWEWFSYYLLLIACYIRCFIYIYIYLSIENSLHRKIKNFFVCKKKCLEFSAFFFYLFFFSYQVIVSCPIIYLLYYYIRTCTSVHHLIISIIIKCYLVYL